MSKPYKSKLDPFAGTLLEMNDEMKSLKEIQSWLKGEGCVVALSTLSDYLEELRSQRTQKQILGDIVSGSAKCREIDAAFAKNPAPELQSIISLLKVLIMQLATEGRVERESLKLADQLTRTAMEFISGEAKHALEKQKLNLQERRVSLLEKKAAQADATDKVLSDQELTAEQREQRIKEIYGRA